jgi:uncharacterized membrane protein
MLEAFYQSLEKLGYTHPLHPTQVNMPIGLVVAAFVLLVIALLLRRGVPARCGRYCAVMALVFIIPTVIAGIMDWQHYFSGGWIYPIKLKMGLAALLFSLLLTAFFLGRNRESPSPLLLAVYGLCLATIVALGYLGAELVFAGRTPSAAPEYADGREIFRSHCSGCHPYGANIIHADKHLWDSPMLASPRYLTGWLRNPVAPMPVFSPSRLSDEEVRRLFAYLNAYFYRKSGPEEAAHDHE